MRGRKIVCLCVYMCERERTAITHGTGDLGKRSLGHSGEGGKGLLPSVLQEGVHLPRPA